MAAIVLAGLFLNSCAAQGLPRTPGAPSPPPQGAAPPAVPSQAVSAPRADAVVEVTVRYLQRIALPPALLTVTLEDVSRADVAATIVAKEELQTNGKQVPLTVKLACDPSQIDSRHAYSVRARIEVGGVLQYTNTRAYPVLTRGAPSIVEVIVEPVAR